jgi:YbgC/YbaW family acyl-CoA thioester hydrolase
MGSTEPVGSPNATDVRAMEDAPLLLEGRQRLTIADSDFAGLVYHSRPYEWQERLMGEWLVSVGYPISSIIRSGFACPVVHSEATYRREIGLDDEVVVELRALRVGTSSFTLGASCLIDGERCIDVAVTHVWCETVRGGVGERPRLESRRLPGWLAAALQETAPRGLER